MPSKRRRKKFFHPIVPVEEYYRDYRLSENANRLYRALKKRWLDLGAPTFGMEINVKEFSQEIGMPETSMQGSLKILAEDKVITRIERPRKPHPTHSGWTLQTPNFYRVEKFKIEVPPEKLPKPSKVTLYRL